VDFIQQLRARGILPGLGGAIKVIESVGSATPRIPRPIAPVPVGRPFNPLNPIVGPRGTSPVPNPKVISNVGRFARGSIPSLVAEGALMLGDRFIPGGVPSEVRGAVQGTTLGYMLGGPPGAALGLLAGADLSNERGLGAGSLTGEFERGTLKLDPLEARNLYMQQVPGSERSMDIDAPEIDLTYSPVDKGGRNVDRDSQGSYLFDSSVGAPRYKQYETTPEGQYERYFKTPEFDYVFGSGARGEGAPKDAAAMEALGSQLKADPESRNIASMYAAQSAMGRINQDAIQKMYEGDKNMQAWAKANPMLAQREYLKSQERQAAVRPPLEGEEINNAVNANREAELRERFTALEGADQPKFVIEDVLQPAAKDEKSARAKLLQRALTYRILDDDQDFPADAPKILN